MASLVGLSLVDRSPLERLPMELAWQVIDYAPDAALEMRLASHTLKKQVDYYARAAITTLVKKLSFADVRLPGTKKAPGYICVMFDVAPTKSGLFYLRLYLQGKQDFKAEMKRMQGVTEEEPLFYNRNFFSVEFDSDKDNFQKDWDMMREWLGLRIGKLMFCAVAGEQKLSICTTLLEGIQFGRLKFVCSDVLVDDDVNHMLLMLRLFRVGELAITVSYIKTKADPVAILRSLSANVRSLMIYQTPNQDKEPETPVGTKYLFGTTDVDWAEIILELFNGKMDKLCIKNPSYPEYLSSKAADRLKDELPGLQKNIWFMGTCNKIDQMNFEIRDYSLKVNPAPAPPANGNQNAGQDITKQYLAIKHKTRVDEPSPDPYLVEDDIVKAKSTVKSTLQFVQLVSGRFCSALFQFNLKMHASLPATAQGRMRGNEKDCDQFIGVISSMRCVTYYYSASHCSFLGEITGNTCMAEITEYQLTSMCAPGSRNYYQTKFSPSVGIWSEWASVEPCPATCGACTLVKRERTCTGKCADGSACPCKGLSTDVGACGVPMCDFPTPTCCNGTMKMVNEYTRKFYCAPVEIPCES